MHLYVHVPFCRRKCAYCGFASAPAAAGDMAAYVQALLREMRLRADQAKGQSVQTLFFGGGTPSLLPQPALERILAVARSWFAWAKDPEVTLEANPDSVPGTPDIRAWQQAGITRVSMGVQSLDPDILHFLGRTHTPDQARTAMERLTKAGMPGRGVDVIWGIPGQDLTTWLDTVDEILDREPDHLSMYALTLEPGTPLSRRQTRRELIWPDEEILEQMFFEARERALRAGFEHYEISNYARPGQQCRHNAGIWQGDDYLGLGPAAVSTLDGVRRENPATLQEYLRLVDQGRPAPVTEFLPAQTRLKERVMLGLRTRQGVVWDEVESGLAGTCASRRDFVGSLQQAGLAAVVDGCLRLTPQGMLVSNEILAALI